MTFCKACSTVSLTSKRCTIIYLLVTACGDHKLALCDLKRACLIAYLVVSMRYIVSILVEYLNTSIKDSVGRYTYLGLRTCGNQRNSVTVQQSISRVLIASKRCTVIDFRVTATDYSYRSFLYLERTEVVNDFIMTFRDIVTVLINNLNATLKNRVERFANISLRSVQC